MKGITLERLEVLRKIAQGEGVLHAAEGSKSRQGLYSRQLRELEEACGMSLVDRQHRRLQLTRKGAAVVHRFEQLLEELGEAGGSEREESGLRIGGGEVALVEGIIPRLQGRFEELGEVIQFRNLRSADAIRLFRRGELDLVLSSVAPEPRLEGEGGEMLCEIGYIYVAPPMAKATKGLFLKTLLGQKLALLEGRTPIRVFLEKESEKLGQPLKLGALCSTYGQILNLVEKGQFYGVIPSLCGPAAEQKGLQVKRLLSENPPPYQVWLLYRKEDLRARKSLPLVLEVMGNIIP